MGKVLTEGSHKVTHANFENILENCCGNGLQGICDDINHPYRVVNSGDKRISKTFVEIAGCLGYQQRHHKQVTTQEMCKIRNVN